MITRTLVGALAAAVLSFPVVVTASDCPSGDPLNCHPGFVACNGETLGEVVPLVVSSGAPAGMSPGVVRILNSATELNIDADAGHFVFIGTFAVHVADNLADIPSSPAAYAYQFPIFGTRGNINLTVPMFPGSSAYIAISSGIASQDFSGDVEWLGVANPANPIYYSALCPPPCATAAGQFRTQTQGGWGSVASGGNPGAYRDANFDAVFPNDLVVGCNKTLRYTTSAAVEEFLPAGGPASALKASAVDPLSKSIKNVLAGQVTALALSVGFDAADSSFGGSGFLLRDLLLASGPFSGWTVQALLDEANRALGACGSAYSFSELNAAVSDVNENFVDGTEAGTSLICPAN